MNPATTLLDFIRYEKKLLGTKIGCREGDCRACTVLVGELKGDAIAYSSVTSCLMPLANASGKHILTIEGINVEKLNAVQEAFIAEGATQCGFCTPGMVFTAHEILRQHPNPTPDQIRHGLEGNMCRCTGYQNIVRSVRTAAATLGGQS